MSDIIKMDFEETIDWDKVPVDTKVFVRDSENGEWYKRHFAKYEDGKVYVWDDGKTSFSSKYNHSWNCVKLYKEEDNE